MFAREGFSPRLADKDLVLTYDDGPGPNTIKIAEYLSARSIRATFFVVGKYVRERPDGVRKVAELGHVIGNHTDTHRSLPELVSEPEALSKEVLECDREIQRHLGVRPFLFRAPGLAWAPEIAELLNRNPEFEKYRGPFDRDICCADYDVGRPSPNHQPDGLPYTLQRAQANYLQAIQGRGSGVVLLHDWAANEGDEGEALRRNNQTLRLTEWLIPQLEQYGFRFRTLDEVV